MATSTVCVLAICTFALDVHGQCNCKAYLFFSTLLHRAMEKIRSTEILRWSSSRLGKLWAKTRFWFSSSLTVLHYWSQREAQSLFAKARIGVPACLSALQLRRRAASETRTLRCHFGSSPRDRRISPKHLPRMLFLSFFHQVCVNNCPALFCI